MIPLPFGWVIREVGCGHASTFEISFEGKFMDDPCNSGRGRGVCHRDGSLSSRRGNQRNESSIMDKITYTTELFDIVVHKDGTVITETPLAT